MGTARLHPDFKDFLRLLEEERVDYLLIGGYAVGYYGYPRATADMDVWIDVGTESAEKMVAVLKRFGLDVPQLEPGLFLEPGRITRIGVPPVRIEIQTRISGVEFRDCFSRRRRVDFDGVETNLIDLPDLKANKKASGRHKDLDDLEHLP